MFERDTFLKLAFRVKRMSFWVVVIWFEVERLSMQAEKFGGARCVADFCQIEADARQLLIICMNGSNYL
jgi:hypothetical protein